MDELKPCPFCGDAEDLSIVRINDSAQYWCIECESCDYNRYIFGTKQEVIKAWNTRPSEDALKAEIERLEEKVARIKMLLVFRRNVLLNANIFKGVEITREYNALNLIIESINTPDTNVDTKESEVEDE